MFQKLSRVLVEKQNKNKGCRAFVSKALVEFLRLLFAPLFEKLKFQMQFFGSNIKNFLSKLMSLELTEIVILFVTFVAAQYGFYNC